VINLINICNLIPSWQLRRLDQNDWSSNLRFSFVLWQYNEVGKGSLFPRVYQFIINHCAFFLGNYFKVRCSNVERGKNALSKVTARKAAVCQYVQGWSCSMADGVSADELARKFG
jgi:hypothetical protein